MPYDEPSSDFKAISKGAKSSPEFRKMTGESEDAGEEAAEGGGELADLGDAYEAAQSKDKDAFTASLLSAIKTCVAEYGSKK